MITQKLYSPVYCFLDELDEDREFDYGCDYGSPNITQQDAAYYYDEVHAAILKQRLPQEASRGLMKYYNIYDNRDGCVDEKVNSLFVDVEVHEDKLWGVATIEVTEELTMDELDELRDYLSGQYSDGFGEGFEQREIKTGNGELYVSLWSHESSFRIMTEEEFCAHLWPEQVQDMTQGM